MGRRKGDGSGARGRKGAGKAGDQSGRPEHSGDDAVEFQAEPRASAQPPLRRSRSWLKKVAGIALLPCEDDLAELLERISDLRAGGVDGAEALHSELLTRHRFVALQEKPAPAAALADGVSCSLKNFRLNVGKFKQWLKTSEGRPFEEKGKGYDDGCYLTSALLRAYMPRGFTTFTFSRGGESETVFLKGFLKFTGLNATDEDEVSRVTEETDAFMFHGFTQSDASRFVVTTKSNGENGKYTVREVFGEWYVFAGSKNTGVVWRFGCDAAALYPLGKDAISSVGPKIVSHVNEVLEGMESQKRKALFERLHADRLTVMVELNDPAHEHIFPITELWAEHVAILDSLGYPIPQRDAFAFFDMFGLRHVDCQIHDDMCELDDVMAQIRASTSTEGAVIYLERVDDKPVGLVKIKSDHYVVARRTRETMRATVVDAMQKGAAMDDALAVATKRLRNGMKELKHVAQCEERHQDWAEFAIAFATSWATAYAEGTPAQQKALVAEYHGRYGSMYAHFYEAWQRGERRVVPACVEGTTGSDAVQPGASDRTDAPAQKGGKGKGRSGKWRARK